MLALVFALSTPPKTSFVYTNPKAKDVRFAGDISGWSTPVPLKKGDGARWTVSFDIGPRSRFEYKFIVDGAWIQDPKNPKKMDNGLGEGQANSVFESPDYRLSLRDATPASPFVRQSLMVDGREVIVWAPTKSQGLPILVYGDGQNYEGIGKVQNVVANLVAERKIRPMVLALVPPKDRMQEYWQDWKPYADFLFQKALPAVRQSTGASSKPEDLFLGGSSLGGTISLRLAEAYPDLVRGGIHSQSGAFQWLPLGIKQESLVTKESLSKLHPGLKLWLCWGTFEHELTDANVEAAKTLKSMKIPFGSLVTNEGHNWTAWRNRMEAGLVYLFGTDSKTVAKTR